MTTNYWSEGWPGFDSIFLMILNPGYLVGSLREVKNKHCFPSYLPGKLKPDLGGWCPSTGLRKTHHVVLLYIKALSSWERGLSLNYLLRLLFGEGWL